MPIINFIMSVGYLVFVMAMVISHSIVPSNDGAKGFALGVASLTIGIVAHLATRPKGE